MEVFKKTIKIALFVSLASLVNFDFIADGFIVAMSVLVMEIFIFCYEEIPVIYITFCSAVFSPMFRLMTLGISTRDYHMAANFAVPDITFFAVYGILYVLIYKYVIRGEKTTKNFPFVIFFADLGSNIAEMLMRSALQDQILINNTVLGSLIIVALCRTLLVQVILLAMERYSSLLIDEEHNREYHKLLAQSAIYVSELHIMEKNASEIEKIMVDAYSLYKAASKEDMSQEIKDKSLEIAKNAHEIKGVYLNVIETINDSLKDGLEDSRMTFKNLLMIERRSLQSIIKNKKYKVELIVHLRANFYVESYFKMMSVLRNLLLNAAEAIGTEGGKITLTLKEENENYVLAIHDNGPGIDDKDLETIFLDGYSSKFNRETGSIQRGMGLTVVKDYVENYYHGKIEVQSRKNVFTKFTLSFPKNDFEQADL